MDYISAVIYGLVQGLTEFFPVSSSGHLALLPKFLSQKDPGVVFDLMMHVGTALAVICYYFKEIKGLMVRRIFRTNIIISCAATVVGIVVLKMLFGSYGRNVLSIAINLAVFGVLMLLADYIGGRRESKQQQALDHDQLGTKILLGKALLIGLFQSFAIFPGVSRSGATLTISRMLRISRRESTHYSFLLALPIIVAGALSKLPEVVGMNFPLIPCLLGIGVSFGVGILAISFFLRLFERTGPIFFVLYRLGLAGLLLSLL